MSETKLKPCPFCGGEIKQMFLNNTTFEPCVWDKSVGNVSTWFHCYKCDSEFFHDEPIDTPEKQVEWWNTRKPVDDVLERLEALKEYEKMGDCPKDGMCDHHNCGTCYTDSAIEIVKEVMGYD